MAVRLDDSNLNDYLKSNYKVNNPEIEDSFLITSSSFPRLLQKNYGDDMDCTLVSLTACIVFYLERKLTPKDVYPIVEQYASKFLYNGRIYGTLPTTIKSIYDACLKHFGIRHNTKAYYFKNICFTFDSIKKILNQKTPIILNIHSDGRGYYKSHSVSVIGYKVYKTGQKLLAIQDNWHMTVSYVDFDKISILSSINY